ncbi:MAG: dTDP-4-dehydrorhamnose 3,5-epimerase [Planctomycetaceae bacterium]|nr:dTDP-4-dehydrorhamnose 3,5-epimerase [Planctomycetaceae bacterium]
MTVQVSQSSLPGVLIFKPQKFEDERGFFMETFRKSWLGDLGIEDEFIQHNQSCSKKNVLRGLHYQLTTPQSKLVRVLRGSVWDVAVDVRYGSPSFSHWFGTVLSDENHTALYIPRGFAHGFFVLSDTAEVHYLSSDYYDPEAERGIKWCCPKLSINWPISQNSRPFISLKDASLPILHEIDERDLFLL